jgi:hypothetical protein
LNSTQKTLEILNKLSVKVRLLDNREKRPWLRKWKRAFLVPVPKKLCRKSIYDGEYFATFYYALTPCLKKKGAVKVYSKQREKDWIIHIWDGYPERVIACQGKILPTLKQLEKIRDLQHAFADIYITPTDLRWTFCITHEPECGPYYSQPPKGWRSKLNINTIKRKIGSRMIAYLNGKPWNRK